MYFMNLFIVSLAGCVMFAHRKQHDSTPSPPPPSSPTARPSQPPRLRGGSRWRSRMTARAAGFSEHVNMLNAGSYMYRAVQNRHVCNGVVSGQSEGGGERQDKMLKRT